VAHRSHSLLCRMTASSWSAAKATVTTRLPRAAALASNTDGTVASPAGRAGDHPPDRLRATSSSRAVLSTCPTHRSPKRSPTVNGGQPPCPQSRPSSRERPREGASQARGVPVEEEPFCNPGLPTDPRHLTAGRPCPGRALLRGWSLVVGWGCAGRRTAPARRPRRARPGRRGARSSGPRCIRVISARRWPGSATGPG